MELFHTHVSEASIRYVNEVMKSGFLNAGKYTEVLENTFSHQGYNNPILLHSCTDAIHIALLCEKIKQGDEVITSALSFVATGLAILMVGATPIFAEVDENGMLDPEHLETFITEKTRAIMPICWCGIPPKLNEICAIGQKYGIPIITDAAHGLGSSINNVGLGSIGDYSCFSFQAIKICTGAEGGLLCIKDSNKIDKARKLSWFGINKKEMKRTELGDRANDIEEIGYKYNISDIQSAMILGNFLDLPQRIEKRTQNASTFLKEFAYIDGLELPILNKRDQPNWWLFPIKVQNRHEFVQAMLSRGVKAIVPDRRMDRLSLFKKYWTYLPALTYFDNHYVTLPCHETLTEDDITLIVQSVQKGW